MVSKRIIFHLIIAAFLITFLVKNEKLSTINDEQNQLSLDNTNQWIQYSDDTLTFIHPAHYTVEERVPGFYAIVRLDRSFPQHSISIDTRKTEGIYDNYETALARNKRSLNIDVLEELNNGVLVDGTGGEEPYQNMRFYRYLIKHEGAVISATAIIPAGKESFETELLDAIVSSLEF